MFPGGCLLLLFHLASAWSSFVLIRTDKGLLRGRRESQGQFAFEGIPYAQPPRRFEPSEPHAHWTGVKNASSVPNSCSQPGIKSSSEDCLFLSVHTPGLGPKARLPVWVWIHGGDFSKGGMAQEGDPRIISRTGIVVVMIQYRLGPFGFTVFNDDKDQTKVNLGFMDQTLALDWVKSNIRRFGGDLNRIILGGSGAGGHSAAQLALRGGYAGLIVSSSGISKTPWISTELEAAKAVTRELGVHLSCSLSHNLKSCLSTKSAVDIMNQELSFHPVMESGFDLASEFSQRNFSKGFSLLIGDISYHEKVDLQSRLKMYLSEDHIHNIQVTSPIYEQIIWKLFPKYPSAVHHIISHFYKNHNAPRDDHLESILRIITDAKYKCPVDSLGSLLASKVPVYRYTLSAGVQIGGESPLVFLPRGEDHINSTLSQFMVSAWSNFIKYGNPTQGILLNSSSIGWPIYEEPSRYKMLLSEDMLKIVSDESQGSCSFWNKLIPDVLSSLPLACESPKKASLLSEEPQVRSLPRDQKGQISEVTSNEVVENAENTTVVSYKLNVLNSPYKMLYERPGNSPIFISSLADQEPILSNEVPSERVDYYRKAPSDTARDYFTYYSVQPSTSTSVSSVPSYDPFHHQVQDPTNPKDSKEWRSYVYYPNERK